MQGFSHGSVQNGEAAVADSCLAQGHSHLWDAQQENLTGFCEVHAIPSMSVDGID